MTRLTKYYPFEGGLDLVTPPLALEPGYLLGSLNYEIETGTDKGYRRIDGYERFDGNTLPSEAVYWIVNFDAGTSQIVTDDILGEVSGVGSQTINMVALADAVLTSGAWDGTGVGYVAVGFDSSTGKLSASSLVNNDPIYEDTVLKATAVDAPIENGASTDALDTTYAQAAIEHARGVISAVPGTGNINGVWVYKGDVYAFRDNAGSTAGVMHKATATGWAAQSLGYQMTFTSGSNKASTDPGIEVGDTITGATTGTTAVVTYIALTNNDWAGGNAAGYVYFLTEAVSNFNGTENLDVGADANIATTTTAAVANTLATGGKYEFVNHNFKGALYTENMYGVNGVGKAFQWDGTNFCFITTGMTTDEPTHLVAHKKHLMLSFPNGSHQVSSIGEPLEWSVITGAGEISTSGDITGYAALPGSSSGDSLAIFNRNRTYVLYGSASSGDDTWNLKQHSDESGAVEWTVQRIGKPFYLDDRGLTNLAATDRYGDFENGVISEKVKQILTNKKKNILSTLRVRDKNQYRLMFDDSTALTASFEKNNSVGFTEQSYEHPMNCACSSECVDGCEILYTGTQPDDSSDAYVMKMDSGTNFDGAQIEGFLRPAFNHFKSPEHKKRFFKVALEVTAPDPFTMQFTPDMTYSAIEDITQTLSSDGAGGFWDISNWDEFEWGGEGYANPYADIDGSGKNLGLFIYTTGTYEQPHIIHSATVHYSIRGLSR